MYKRDNPPRPNRIALCPAKLAFRRKGPVSAPAKTLLALPVRGGYDEPVEVRRDLDLTTEPRVGLNLIGKIQHIFFLVRRLAGATHPFFADIDVARRAGTAAAAFGGDLGDRVADGVFHDRGAFLRLDGPGFAKGVDIGDLDHESRMFRRRAANEGSCSWGGGAKFILIGVFIIKWLRDEQRRPADVQGAFSCSRMARALS